MNNVETTPMNSGEKPTSFYAAAAHQPDWIVTSDEEIAGLPIPFASLGGEITDPHFPVVAFSELELREMFKP